MWSAIMAAIAASESGKKRIDLDGIDITSITWRSLVGSVLVGAIIAGIIIFCSVKAHAFDGDIYAGMYFDSTLSSSPLHDDYAKYVNGITVGHNIKKLRGYVNVETLSDDYNGDGTFHPDSVKYTVGLRYNIWKGLDVVTEHSCWHPVDGAGHVEQYNLIKFNYHFGEPTKW